MNRNPPFSATIEMSADPQSVWEVISDLARMPEFSPELRKVYVWGRPGLGAHLVGVNRRGAVVWPTTSTVVRWEPGRALAWRTRESGATWVYELEAVPAGTRVTSRRVLARRTLATALIGPLLGGADGHEVELAEGLRTTLERMRRAIES